MTSIYRDPGPDTTTTTSGQHRRPVASDFTAAGASPDQVKIGAAAARQAGPALDAGDCDEAAKVAAQASYRSALKKTADLLVGFGKRAARPLKRAIRLDARSENRLQRVEQSDGETRKPGGRRMTVREIRDRDRQLADEDKLAESSAAIARYAPAVFMAVDSIGSIALVCYLMNTPLLSWQTLLWAMAVVLPLAGAFYASNRAGRAANQAGELESTSDQGLFGDDEAAELRKRSRLRMAVAMGLATVTWMMLMWRIVASPMVSAWGMIATAALVAATAALSYGPPVWEWFAAKNDGTAASREHRAYAYHLHMIDARNRVWIWRSGKLDARIAAVLHKICTTRWNQLVGRVNKLLVSADGARAVAHTILGLPFTPAVRDDASVVGREPTVQEPAQGLPQLRTGLKKQGVAIDHTPLRPTSDKVAELRGRLADRAARRKALLDAMVNWAGDQQEPNGPDKASDGQGGQPR